MTWRNRDQRFIQSCHLDLQPVDLSQISGNSVVIALFLHLSKGFEIGTITELLAKLGRHENCRDNLVDIKRGDTSVNFVDEAGSKHVVLVLLVEMNHAHASVNFAVHV